MTKREPLQTEEYFDEAIAFDEKAIAEDQQLLVTKPAYIVKLNSLALFLLSDQRNLLIAKYSRGYPVAELRADFPAIIDTWEQLIAIDTAGTYTTVFKDGLDYYVRAFWLLAQAYLLGTEPAVQLRTLACIGNEGQDLLFERFVARLFPGIKRKPASKLLYPNAYQALYDALDAPAEQQAALVQQFLKTWYKRMGQASWHNNHNGQDGGGFFGYWCWEAVGVARAFGIDDSTFRDLRYYPRAMADFASQGVGGQPA